MRTLNLADIPEEGLHLDWTEERASLIPYLETLSRIDFDFEGPLNAEVRVWKVGQSILLKGSVRTVLRLQCVRCLQEFSHPLSSMFDLTLHPLKETGLGEETELNKEDMESGFFDGAEIHLSEIACEQVFLEIPCQPLCQEACKGMCPLCGKDLNLGSCHCTRPESGSSFSVLQKLKPDA